MEYNRKTLAVLIIVLSNLILSSISITTTIFTSEDFVLLTQSLVYPFLALVCLGFTISLLCLLTLSSASPEALYNTKQKYLAIIIINAIMIILDVILIIYCYL